MIESERRKTPVESLMTVPENPDSTSRLATNRPNDVTYRVTMASIWTIVILVLCWMPRNLVKEVEKESNWFEIPNLDKVVHWGIFVVFTVLWLRVGTSRWRYAWVALGGVALGAVSEAVQSVPWIGRDASVNDAITDVIGVAIGLSLARWIEPLLRGLESRLFPGSTS